MAGVLTAYGCDREADSTKAPVAGSPSVAQATVAAQLHFATPEGWQVDPTPRAMREATLLVGTGEKSAEVVVTKLSGTFGDFGNNINRWRGQIGLDPLADPSSVSPRVLATPVGEAKLVKLEAADKASVIAMVKQGEHTWFFRLTGERSTVNENEAKLEHLLASLSAGK